MYKQLIMSEQANFTEISNLTEQTLNTDNQLDVNYYEKLITETPYLKNDPEIQALLKEEKEKLNKQQPQKNTIQEPIIAEKALSENIDSEKEEEVENQEEADSIFFSNNTKKEEPKTLEELYNTITKKFGINAKDEKGLQKFVSSSEKWRTDAQRGVEAQKKYDELLSEITELPPLIKKQIEAYANGLDFKSVFNDNKYNIDYSKEFEKHKKEDIVSHYFNEDMIALNKEFKEDNIDEDKYNKEIDRLYGLTKKVYSKDYNSFKEEQKREFEKAKVQKENFTTSIDNSIEYLKEEFPDFKESQLKEIKNELSKGDILSHFFNKNGTVKKEAAEMLALMKYGKKEVAQYKSKAKQAQDTTEQVISLADKKVKTTNNRVDEKSEEDALLKQYGSMLDPRGTFSKKFKLTQI